jgi:hypothetical protein
MVMIFPDASGADSGKTAIIADIIRLAARHA